MWEDGLWFDPGKREAVARCLKEGWGIADSELIEPMQRQVSFSIPWIFAGPHPHTPNCSLWNQFYFSKFGLIPRYCRTRCHKVVVKPRTVKELFLVHEVQKALNHPGKCGVDTRPYTNAAYAGFWYCRSMEEGRERYKEVREHLDQYLPDGRNIPLILKKGCTEMEDPRNKGGKSSDQWGEPNQEETDFEDRLDHMFSRHDPHVTQPEWLKQKIQLDWLEYAYSIGDSTYKEVIPTDIFGVKTINYAEDQPKQGGK